MSAIHDKLGKAAFQMLPEWERKLWAGQRDQIPEYCFLPDNHLIVQLEPEKEKALRKYCVMPNGKAVPHGPCDDAYHAPIFSNYHSRRVRHYVINYYLGKIVELLSEKEFAEAAKFGGVLAHYFQDVCCPVHVLNGSLLNRLFPPDSRHSWHFHRVIDVWPFDEKQVSGTPALLGVSLEEAVFRACMEYDRATAAALAEICPFITAIRENRHTEADAVNNRVNALAARLSASVWHSAFCLAFARFENTEIPDHLLLADCIPVNEVDARYSRERFKKYGVNFGDVLYHEADPPRSLLSNDPYPFEPLTNTASDGKGKSFPLALRVTEAGRTAEKIFNKGFASGGTSMLVFEAPGNIFKEFRAFAGIHPASPADSKASFAVFCEQPERGFSGNQLLTVNDSALEFRLPLSADCKTVSMIVTEGSPGVHAIWGNPRLIKI